MENKSRKLHVSHLPFTGKCCRLLLQSMMGLMCFIPLQAQHLHTTAVTIRVDTTVTQEISPDFIGFGYETSAVAQAGYFSPENRELVRLYRNLSCHGLIRIGGNISDHARYEPNGVSAAHTEKQTTLINHVDLVALAGFARETGWQVMWGLNLGTGSSEQAAGEAAAVEASLGASLQCFQIGNEVDLQSNYDRKFKDFDAYHAAYISYQQAIQKKTSGVPFSGPDVAGNLVWFRSFAQQESSHIKLLTFHYYRTGAHHPKATISTLLAPDTGWDKRLDTLAQVSLKRGVPYRINEVNSFSGGGKPGVSDVFASALWCLDYMFSLASKGCNGVNMETDINQLGWISHYSPIIHDAAGHCSVRPEYYGMLAFSWAGTGQLVKTDISKGDINLSAYATKGGRDKGAMWVTVVNKDLANDGQVKIQLPSGYGKGLVFRLKAPSVSSKGPVTLGGTAVAADGSWTPGPPGKIVVKENNVQLTVPHTSAVLVRFMPAK